MVEIRRVRSEEWEALRDLRLEALLDAPDAFWTLHEEAIARSDEEWRAWTEMPCHIAADGERLVGMVSAWADGADPTIVDLIAMYVTPAARGQGIGRRLVEAQLAWAKAEGFRTVRLMVNVRRRDAVALYERCGFRDSGLRESLRGGPETLAELLNEL